MDDALTWSAAELARRIAQKKISAAEYAALLEQQCAAETDLCAYISQDFGVLRTAARAADNARSRGPLHGVPIGVKDNIDTVDLPTSGGTPALKNNRPPKNAPAMERLYGAGALLAGKLNMHELAFGGTNDNMAFGRAKNPVNRSRVPGGSSGGSAVAVAAHLSPAALGSDTAGSVRVPAALCGTFGFRPTLGRYPAAGVVPIAHSRDCVGSLARTIEDIALLDGILAADTSPLPKLSPSEIRIGVDRERFYKDAEPSIVRALDQLMAEMRKAGMTIVEMTLESDPAAYGSVTGIPIAYEAVPDFEAYLATSAPGVTIENIMAQAASPILRTRLAERWQKRGSIPDAVYQKAIGPDLTKLRESYRKTFFDHHLSAILLPTTHDVALPFAGDDDVLRKGEVISSWFYFRNTAHATIIGAPSLTVPAGRDDQNGLPVGALFDGLPGGDRALIAVGEAISNVMG
jgi:mandelamide amidase